MLMKIAAVTDDGTRLSAHFGRAAAYRVVTIEDGRVVAKELREKPSHHGHGHEHGHEHGHGHGQGHGHGHEDHAARHAGMVDPIRDCQVVLVRGMGRRAHDALVEAGLRPLIVAEANVDDAVRAYLDGTLEDHPERLH
jgi:predicted Fe-Mo cluster-binding NifX family protein